MNERPQRAYHRDGTPITTWADYHTAADTEPHIEYTWLTVTRHGPLEIATTYLLHDASHPDTCGPPLIYQTLLTGPEQLQAVWRYTCEEQARKGHARLVNHLRAGHPLETPTWPAATADAR